MLHVNHSHEDAEHDAAQIRAAGGSAIVLAADLREPAAIEQMLDESCRHFGRIDALVNCAAIWSPKPLEQVTPADVRQYFEVNELGTFLCCQQVGLYMTAQVSGGAIVNFGDWAISRPYPGHAAYFPSKGAIPTLTRTFAVELAAQPARASECRASRSDPVCRRRRRSASARQSKARWSAAPAPERTSPKQ